MSETYMDQVLSGYALWTDADDWVERWHVGEGAEQELHEFLGMTWDEYKLWVEQPSALRMIIAAREHGEPLVPFIGHTDELAFAARGLSAHDAHAVRTWLRKTGRLPG